ncbi:MAG: hypothetical protein PF485_12670 [Bacteroidales bacterium]|jgi:uncharacterized repeat protein (TIGR03987 family)|nr:hypothetical protein [Bacteroidales bacterium]
MKTISMIGAIVVTLALISYSIGVITEQRKRKLVKAVLLFITVGIVLDITATICMIIGSTNSPFTIHGFLGYSALIAMLIDVVLIWKFYYKNPAGTEVPKKLHRYTLYAYLWWVVAYVTGSLLVMMK